MALSSTEAEYMAMDAMKEALLIQSFMKELLGRVFTLTLFNDNQSAQKLAENIGYSGHTKHIDIRHHFIREVMNNNLVLIKCLSTEEMFADILTKPFSQDKFWKFVSGLGFIMKT